MQHSPLLTHYLARTMMAQRLALVLCLLLGGFSYSLRAQTAKSESDTTKKVEPPRYASDRLGDPFSRRFTSSPFWLRMPSIYNLDLKLDTSGSFYRVQEKIGDINYRPPSQIYYKSFRDWRSNSLIREYWSGDLSPEDTAAVDPPGESLIPPIPLGNGLNRLFGGDEITIQPNGSVTLDFGGLWQRVDNPNLTIRQQRTGGFNFDQQIRMNLVGKVGEKMDVNFNFDTKNTFQFEQAYNINYTAFEEDVIQAVELGNVSFPVQNSLITGAQNLFGVKTRLRFGKLWINAVASNQRGTTETIRIKNGGQSQEFEIRADSYEENRHFFLAHFFRDNYERSLRNLPVVNSGVVVRRVEVYVTNRNNNTENTRNILGITNLGRNFNSSKSNPLPTDNSTQSNGGNDLYAQISGLPNVRRSELVSNLLQNNLSLQRGGDFEVVTTSRRLQENEFTLNSQLGYISLNTPLRNDEVLAVSFEYTYNGQRYKVGEMTEDYQGAADEDIIILKMLRPSTIRTDLPDLWDLMMKNIYSLQTNQLRPEGFQGKIIYKDDNTGLDQPTLQEGINTQGEQLSALMRIDQLNMNRDPQPDGNIDYLEGVTIDSRNGRVIFPVLEPFGITLGELFNPNSEQFLIDKYVFEDLYRQTQINAKLNRLQNKYYLKGSYQAGGSTDINLPGINIAEGSVVVRAGSTTLTEGSDFTVDYQFGRVKITNQAVLSSSKEIIIQFERADLFSMNTRTLAGVDLEYRLSKDVRFTGTLMHFNERPLLSRVAIGSEPVRNTVFGGTVDYQGDSRLLTKLVDKLPGVSTKEESSVDIKAEFAGLIPGSPRLVGTNGVAYIDDFEGAEVSYDLTRSPQNWTLGSVPELIKEQENLTLTGTEEDLQYNARRARMAWYNIDNIFYIPSSGVATRSRPASISTEDMENQYVRLIPFNEVFPNRQGTQINTPEASFDLAYYPDERGPYNYNDNPTDWDADGRLRNPEKNFASITRAINHDVNFDNINIQYVEFWMMDPFIDEANKGVVRDGANTSGGQLYINLGNISEDVLPDGQHFFENGLTTTGDQVEETIWGKVPEGQYLTNAFGTGDGVREAQDVGFDGIRNEEEASRLSVMPPAVQSIFADDPAGDDFRYYLGDEYDAAEASVLERYKYFNGNEGNSPENADEGASFVQSSSILPDNEDLNRDNTLSDLEQYWQYKLELKPNMRVGDQYIVDKVETSSPAGDPVTWYQFRIPLRSEQAENVNGINGFESIRFIRMFMTGWKEPVVLRMVQFQFVGAQWRPYSKALQAPGPATVVEPPKSFVVSSVNIEENSGNGQDGVPYVLPPGFNRDFDRTSTVTRQLNEQSLQVCVDELEDSDGRGVFKNIAVDIINYQNLKMEVHAHSEDAQSGDVTAFLRLGTDETENYYEIEWPLEMTPLGSTIREVVWPRANELDISLADLIRIKKEKNFGTNSLRGDTDGQTQFGKYKIFIKGNPDLSNIQTVFAGVRNPRTPDGQAHSACVWFNELRITDIQDQAGYAANLQVNAQLADFASVSGSLQYSTIGFGGVQDRVADRNRFSRLSYDLSSQINLDQIFLDRLGISLPLFISVERDIETPQFDPLNPDTELNESMTRFRNDEERADRTALMQTITERRSINLINVHKEKRDEEAKSHWWDIENISLSGSYSEEFMRDQFTDSYERKQWSLGATYGFVSEAKPWEPFKEKNWKAPYAQWLKDFNLSPMPSSIQMQGRLDRQFARTQLRNSDFTITGLDPFFEKAFTFTRDYGVQWNLTESVNLDYQANAYAIVDEPFGEINNQAAKDSIWTNLKNLGRMKAFQQSVSASYRLPLDKFPVTDWLNADTRYSADYSWQAGPQGLTDDNDEEINVGNVIQNTQNITVSGKVDLDKLYDKVPFFKRMAKLLNGRKLSSADDPLQIKRRKLKQKIDIRKARIKNIKEREKQKAAREAEKAAAQAASESDASSSNSQTDTEAGSTETLENTTDVGALLEEKKEAESEKDNPNDGKLTRLERLQLKVKELEEEMKELNDLIREEAKKKRGEEKKEEKPGAIGRLLGVALSLKDINISYSETNSTILPGFTPTPQFLGMDEVWQAPGAGFLLGQQDPNFLNRAQQNGWLAQTELQNTPFLQNKQAQLALRTTLEPFKDFKINLEASRSDNGAYSEVRRWDPDQGAFVSQSPSRTGGFSMSYWAFGTAFKGLREDNTSPTFEQFQENLGVIKNRIDPLLGAGAQGERFDSTAQDVMIPAFVAAYTGRSAQDVNLSPVKKGIPMPNWKVTYNGLSKIEAFKGTFKSVSISHGYRSEYSTGTYTSSLFYVDQGVDVGFGFDESVVPFGIYQVDDISGRVLVPVLVYNDISITEEFSPLIGINIRTNSDISIKMDYRKRRDVGLNLSNAQVTEQRNDDITLDVGFTKKDIKVPFSKKVLKNDVTFRLAFTLRNSRTVQHKLEEGSIATNGNMNLQFKPTIDYDINDRTKLQCYFERSINDPVISNSPKRATTAFGFRLTFNLAQD